MGHAVTVVNVVNIAAHIQERDPSVGVLIELAGPVFVELTSRGPTGVESRLGN